VPRALKVCSTPTCPNLVERGRCPTCLAQAEQRRGTRQQRGYGRQHETRFRHGVLRRDPLCVCVDTAHGHGPRCLAPATVADHYPRTRRELVELRLDANDPQYGRGLCEDCHNKHTATSSPGGWNAR
jgi:5-methylcytosine-specific restriction protein A